MGKDVNCNAESASVIITGVGGQGNVLAARLLASAVLEEGYEVTVGDVYGLTQRGGSVASHVRWTREKALPPLIPQESLDVLVAFEPLESLRVLCQYQNKDTVAVVNDTPLLPIGVLAGRLAYPDLPDLWDALQRLAKRIHIVQGTRLAQKVGDRRTLNMIMMGALYGSGFIPLKAALFEDTINALVPRRFREINLRAFRAGMDISFSCSVENSPPKKTKTP
jgi:indolepyruvate ferredoxin oxidoreductase beta subunit